MQAIILVVDIAKKEVCKIYKTRGLCCLMTIDIMNNFNKADWNLIIEELVAKIIEGGLVNIISEYLNDRTFTEEDDETHKMECGVPQGSVFGPLLWNIILWSYENQSSTKYKPHYLRLRPGCPQGRKRTNCQSQFHC